MIDTIPIKLIRHETYDPRCSEIVLTPTNHLCRKWNIPMGEKIKSNAIHLQYRFISKPRIKDKNILCGALIDDLPTAYHPHVAKMYPFLKGYDFIVSPNKRIFDYLQPLIGNKPAILYSGLCAKEYYQDIGVLKQRVYHDDKRMVFTFNGGYHFKIDDFAHNGWKIMYFHRDPIHRKTGIIHKTPVNIPEFYKIVSEFSPDILVQGWTDSEFFKYKADLKYRESVAFSCCLLAQDKENIYHIKDHINGILWQDVGHFHDILDKTHIEEFRFIGNSHIDMDKENLTKLYDDMVDLYRAKFHD